MTPTPRIYLASKSPRRRDLLRQIGVNFDVLIFRSGERGEDAPWARPDREPDAQIVYPTRLDQALLYRLTGDRNPLHSNPEFARQAGFERPILHGMCTYGFTARALLHAVADSDPDHFGGFSARFSKTVDPGDTLTVSIWRTEDGALFQTAKQTGDIVVDRGVMTLR